MNSSAALIARFKAVEGAVNVNLRQGQASPPDVFEAYMEASVALQASVFSQADHVHEHGGRIFTVDGEMFLAEHYGLSALLVSREGAKASTDRFCRCGSEDPDPVFYRKVGPASSGQHGYACSDCSFIVQTG